MRQEGTQSVKLFQNVQFVYELALAMMELDSFGIKYTLTNGLREFVIDNLPNQDLLKKRTAYFEKVNGEDTIYKIITSKNRTRSVNQYLTHWIYPYKGKYHPQMIRALLNYIQLNPGDTVLDPFIGSGTTALEAQLLGINVIGVDISEVCYLISKVKTESIYVLDKIKKIYPTVVSASGGTNLKSFFDDESKTISEVIDHLENEKVKNFFKVAELISHSDRSRRKAKDFKKSFETNAHKMLQSVEDYQQLIKELNLNVGKVDIQHGDARKLNIPSESIDGIICSPPYSIALDYVSNDAHSLKALGHDISKIRNEFIGVRGTSKTKVDLYNHDMKLAYEEMDRVLKPGKYCVIVIGNATLNGQEIKTVEMTIDVFTNLGFKLEKNIDKIIFGLYNVMQKENILVFRKVE